MPRRKAADRDALEKLSMKELVAKYKEAHGESYRIASGTAHKAQKGDLVNALVTGKAYPYTPGPSGSDSVTSPMCMGMVSTRL